MIWSDCCSPVAWAKCKDKPLWHCELTWQLQTFLTFKQVRMCTWSKKTRFALYCVYWIEMSEQFILTIRENQSPSTAIFPAPKLSNSGAWRIGLNTNWWRQKYPKFHLVVKKHLLSSSMKQLVRPGWPTQSKRKMSQQSPELCLLAPQSGALRISAYRDFQSHPNPIPSYHL